MQKAVRSIVPTKGPNHTPHLLALGTRLVRLRFAGPEPPKTLGVCEMTCWSCCKPGKVGAEAEQATRQRHSAFKNWDYFSFFFPGSTARQEKQALSILRCRCWLLTIRLLLLANLASKQCRVWQISSRCVAALLCRQTYVFALATMEMPFGD